MDIKTVFIIGAGASAAAGGPTMREFMKCADRVRRQPSWADESFYRVSEARGRLLGALAKSNINIHNVEDLMSTFEMAHLIKRLANLSAQDVQMLTKSLRFVIMRTIEHAIEFEVDRAKPAIGSPYPYDAFVELLIQIAKIPELGPPAVISFNYDLAMDYALTLREIPIDYALEEPAATDPPDIATRYSRIFHKAPSHLSNLLLLKPHGSLNWFFDQDDHSIVARPVKPFPTASYFRRMGVFEDRTTPLDTMELISGPGAWGEDLRPEPVIVPPTWNKAGHHETLRRVWCRSSGVLSTAENIFVIGYSLPSSDQFFRSFFALSTLSEAMIERFWIFDPGDVLARFQELVGPAVSVQGSFRHEQILFTDAILHLARQLQLGEEHLHPLLQKRF